MTFDVILWEITTSYTGSWNGPLGTYTLSAGNFLHVELDDTTDTLKVWFSPNSSPGGGFELSEGPNLFFGFGGAAVLRTVAPFYQECEGTTLKAISTSNSFPYATFTSYPNNSECQIAPTCDLEISSNYSITPASAPGVPDGAITINGTSSNGLIKYSFNPNFEYGDPFPLYPLALLADWISYNTSSEPMVWSTGSTPELVITAPTTLTPALSDWFGPTLASQTYVPGTTYKYTFQFTAYSDDTRYIWIRIVQATNLFVIESSKIVAGYANPAGLVLNGTFEFVATADTTRLAVLVEYLGGATADGTIEINLFTDLSGTPTGPDVQTSPVFTALVADTYTIYAQDAIGCTDSITFEIPLTIVYGIKYRLEYTDMLAESGKAHRLDILQRAYVGPIIEICGGADPVTIRYEGDRDDPNTELVASNAVIQLLVETAGQFDEMFLGDDRKHLVKHYIDDGAGLELYWTGYIVPEFHSEPYIFEPYPIDITASDGLGELKNEDFLDINDNKFKGDLKIIRLISDILRKTGLELPIRCGINVFDTLMDTDPEDDPLDQLYVDTRIYYPKKVADKCDEVIKSFVASFRGQIFQSQGVWWIIRLSDAVGTFPYREFDFQGNYVSNSTMDPLIELDFPSAIHPEGKAMFANRSQLLTHLRNYGYFAVTHDLRKDGNLIDTGLFESEDIIELASGNKTFQDWNVLVGQPGVQYGHETVVNGDSTGAFYLDFYNAVGNQIDTQLYSVRLPLDNSRGKIRFKFQYFVTPEYNLPWVRIAWTLKFHRATVDNFVWITYGTNGDLTTSNTEAKNEVFVSSYDSWQTIDILTEIPTDSVMDGFEISLYAHDHYGRDFADITALKAFNPATVPNPGSIKRMVIGALGETNLYSCEWSDDAESLPDIVRPTSYNSGSNKWLWRLDKIINVGFATSLVRRIKFDNVSLAFYPLVFLPTTEYIDPPEVLTYSEETDELVTPNFTKEVLLGDMIRLYDFEFRNEKYLYRSYLRLADGTPTTAWARAGVAESKKLLQILLEDYVSQFSLPQRRLSGLKITTRVMHFLNCLRDNVDGTRYRPMTFEFNTKMAMYTPDMAGVVAGEDGEPPYAPGAFDNQEFSTAFSIGN